MRDKTVKKLVFSALFASLCCVATMIIKIPTPIGGYIHAGDAIVVLSAFLLGPWWGALAAGVGSGLADLFAGYALYAPGTLVIKAGTALIAGLFLSGRLFKKPFAKALVGGIIAELFMVAGYLVYEAFLLGYGAAAVGGIPMNLIQAAFGAVAGAFLFAALRKTNLFD